MADGWRDYDKTVEGQAAASNPAASAWVAANAGSGKTKVLIDRVARLLLEGVAPDAVLCVTYTKAAASEMQARLFRRLGGWCVALDEELRRDLGELQGRPAASYGAEDLGKARELFARALETPGGLRIETIHAFCGRLLRRFPLEAGAPPGFRELDDTEARDLWEQALAALGARAGADATLSEAVEALALGAGGRGSAAPLKALWTKQAAFHAYLAAAGGVDGAVADLRGRIGAPDEDEEALLARGMGDDLPRDKIKSAIPALSAGGKTDQKLADALNTALSDGTPADRYAAYRTAAFTGTGALRAKNAFTKGVAAAAPDVADLFNVDIDAPQGVEIGRLVALQARLAARRTYDRSAALLRAGAFVINAYGRRKRARAALDFEDLVETARALLTQASAAEWVLWKLDGGLSHVLLDEAQDTSPSQWALLNALTQEFFAGMGVEREAPRTLFVVGDEKQSIYSFQGADPERFLTERRAFDDRARLAEAAYETPDMEMSFRSAPEVLDFVDAVFATDAFDGEAPFSIQPPAEADLIRHTAFRRAARGCVEFWPLTAPEALEDASPWDAPAGQERETSPKAQLAGRIAARIRAMIEAGVGVGDGDARRPARPGDFMILVRGRKGGLFDALLQALKREGLPVAGADRIDLLDSAPVQDALNFIRFALRPEDDLTLAEILTGPIFGWTEDEDLFPLAHDRGDECLWDRLAGSDAAKHQSARQWLDQLRDWSRLPPFEFLTRILETPAADGRTGWDAVLSRFGPPAREPLSALIDRAAAFDASGPASLQMFLAAIERQGGEVKRELSAPQNEVRVMTVHGAKGLEAPIVILPDTCAAPQISAEAGVFVDADGAPIWSPSAKEDADAAARLRADAEARSLREHRRLLYVGLTRAEDRLLICGAWSGGATHKTGRAERSWHAACERAMTDFVSQGRARIETDLEGAERWILGEDGAAGRAAPQSEAQDDAAPDWLRRPAPKETPQFRTAAPSRMGGETPAVLAPFGQKRAYRLRRGRLIHRLLQVLPELPIEARKAAAEAFLSREADLSADDRIEIAAAAFGVLDHPEFAPIFAPGGRAEAPIVGENALALGEGVVVNGRVDRLLVGPEEVLIVDFKTDRPAPSNVEDVAPAYLAQMDAYRAVLETAYPGRRIRCALVWTDGPRLIEVDGPREAAAGE